MSFECNTYTAIDDNLHAIAKTLEALRAVERHGAVKGGQQYRGWKQLPGNETPSKSNENVDIRMAAACLCSVAGEQETSIPGVIANHEVLQSVYRKASLKAHPDHGGSTSIMAMVNNARDVLERHHAHKTPA